MTAQQLTPEQQALFASLSPEVAASGNQTPAQARATAVWSFQQACLFESIDEPSAEAVLAAMEPPSRFAYYRDPSDGDLVRSSDGFTTQIYSAEHKFWHRFPVSLVELTSITREQAQALAGRSADLEAPA